MKAKPKLDYVIVCDDIRNEVGNKNSYMGVYGENILVQNFPHFFPRLSFVIKLSDFRKHTVSVSLKYLNQEFKLIPEQELIAQDDAHVPTRKNKGKQIILCAGLSPFITSEKGTAILEIKVNGISYTHKFTIEKAGDATILSSPNAAQLAE